MFSKATFGQFQNIEWVKSSYSNFMRNTAYSNTVDKDGNVCITGWFLDTASNLGPVVLTRQSAGNAMFLAKYNSSGVLQWAKTNESSYGSTGGSDITTDNSGNVIVTGTFICNKLKIGSNVYINSDSNTADIFIIKYDSTGNLIWSNVIIGSLNEFVTSIDVDKLGNIFLGGSFNSPISTIDNLTLNNTSISNYHYEMFLAKYTSNGSVIWSKKFGGNYSEQINDFKIDSNNNIYFTGYFQSDTLLLDNVILQTATNYDYNTFIAKSDSNGNIMLG